ncbi:MAG TPA: bifunctional phosphopantothenoylcysteine decarboxylase/phosphopantothenate--cysteine ligase CoaBC [bacterium]|nr:bifunctional phosphopantothenoylcysteine decarboxylase/phosphopantothenate--cysteine ligase CoaBC [bacterium]
MNQRFKDKRILLGVTGSIAAYKACLVLRLLQEEGAEVRVVMTRAAREFIAPLTFETLTGEEVVEGLFSARRIERTRHIRLAEWADGILICPATANLIAKVAAGIADDFLSTVISASRSPVIFAPAMDLEMARNPIYQSNCRKLADLDYRFVASGEGFLASGATGPGRLADPDRIIDGVATALLKDSRWAGKRVLITAGPTREQIDPVRFLSNRSSGKMGYALAEAAFLRGAEVTLVTGPTFLRAMEGIAVHRIETASEMAGQVASLFPASDMLIMAAAVADYTPAEPSDQKLKKDEANLTLSLSRTDDILTRAAGDKGGRIVVGFALETRDGELHAREKLKKKNLDLVCLNNPFEEGAGFETDTNRITLFARDGTEKCLGLLSKKDTAERILDEVDRLLAGGG